MDQIGFTLNAFSTAAGAAPRLDLTARLNETGRLAVAGSLRLDGPAAELTIEAVDLPIQPFQPYFGDRVRLIVTDGRVGAKGRLDLSLPAGGAPRVRYRGGAAITRFASVDKRHARDFLSWQSLFVEGVDLTTEPMAVAVQRVALSDYYARLIVNADGSLNVATIFAAPGTADEDGDKEKTSETEAAPAETAPVPASVRIDQVTLQGGRVDFADLLVKPNFETRMVELGGRISGLSSEGSSRADVLIQGALENHTARWKSPGASTLWRSRSTPT